MRNGILGGALALAIGCGGKPEPVIETTPSPTPVPTFSRPSFTELRKQYENLVRLPLDRRFLLAFSGAHELIVGPAPEASAQCISARTWTVDVGGIEVAKLPELPDFSDAADALSKYATALLAKNPTAIAPPPKRRPPASAGTLSSLDKAWQTTATDALSKIDALWVSGEKDADVLAATGEGLARLTFQGRDDLRVADELAARAFAYLVIARAAGSTKTDEGLAILAEAMGYETAARKFASALPPNDPLRAYVNRNDQVLASVGGRSVAGSYLWHRRLNEQNLATEGRTWARKHFAPGAPSIAVARSRTDLAAFQEERDSANELHFAVLFEAERAGGATDVDALARATEAMKGAAWISTLDATLSRIPESGSLFPATLQRQFLRASSYAAFLQLAEFHLDRRSDAAGARDYAERLGGTGDAVGLALREWILISAAGQTTDVARQALETLDTTPLRGPPTFDLRVLGTRTLDANAAERFVSAHMLVRKMDSRPGDRYVLYGLAENPLSDVALRDRLLASYVSTADRFGIVAVRHAKLEGDWRKLERVAVDQRELARTRISALEALSDGSRLSPAIARSGYESVILSDPAAWHVYESYASHFESRKQYADARKVASRWLTKYGSAPDARRSLLPLAATTLIARMHHLEGNPRAAWKILEPEIPSYYGGVLWRGAFVLVDLKRSDEAIALGEQYRGRYPGPKASILMAAIHWRLRKHDDAARELAGILPGPTSQWRSDAAKELCDALCGKAAELRKATDALIKAGVHTDNVSTLAFGVRDLGHDAEAQVMFEEVMKLGPSNAAYWKVAPMVYRYLKAHHGSKNAIAWANKSLRGNPSYLAISTHGREPDLMWDPMEPVPAQVIDHVWLDRAIGNAFQPSKERQKTLRAHYQAPGESKQHTMGRFLLGLEEEAALEAIATDEASTMDALYVLGIRSEMQGKMADACEWYLAATATSIARPRVTYSYDYAQHRLGRMLAQERSLTRFDRDLAR